MPWKRDIWYVFWPPEELSRPRPQLRCHLLSTSCRAEDRPGGPRSEFVRVRAPLGILLAACKQPLLATFHLSEHQGSSPRSTGPEHKAENEESPSPDQVNSIWDEVIGDQNHRSDRRWWRTGHQESLHLCVCVCVRARVRAPVCVDIPGEVLGVGKIKGKMGKLSHWVAGWLGQISAGKQTVPPRHWSPKQRQERAPEKSSEQKLPLDKCLPSAKH